MQTNQVRGLAAILAPAVFAAAVQAQATQGQASGQGGGLSSPGMPVRSATPREASDASGQTSGFSSVFNPAFAFVVDTLADYSDDDEGDGLSLALRSAELSAKSWIDPKAWAYMVAVAEEEGLSVEEAAIHFKGLGDTHTIRAGRFFADFGKQMQAHVHDLRTVDRPLPLRAYLGSELGGDGVQWDAWTPMGDAGALRWSIGVFASLVPHEHGEEEGEEVERHIEDRKDFGDMNFTARLTTLRDIGETTTLQIGASLLAVPEFAAEFGDLEEVEGLAQNVVGFDATVGLGADGGPKWTLGGEYLLVSGDTLLGIDDAGTKDPLDDSITVDDEGLSGFYVFADYAWDASNSVGVQFAQADVAFADADEGVADAEEIDLYYTRLFSEYHRIRLAVTQASFEDEDSTRVAIQYTGFVGAHAHGVNW